MNAKLKATEIVCDFLESFKSLTFFDINKHEIECEIVAKHRAYYFIKQNILPTIGSEADLKFWKNVLEEINKINL